MSLTTGLVSDWSFDGAPGANETDNGSGGNTLTQHNTVGSGTGLISGDRIFVQGSSQYLQAPSGIISGYGDWTISIWFKPSSTALSTNWNRVFDWGTGTSKYLMCTVRAATDHGPRVELLIGGVTYDAVFTQSLAAGTWYHLVVTCQSNRLTVYLNGAANCGIAGINAQGSTLAPTLCYFGKSQFPDPYYDGSLDQANLWSRALSPQEVQALYNGGAGLSFAQLGGASIPAAPSVNVFGRMPYIMSSFTAAETLLFYESFDLVYWTSFTATYTPSSGSVRDTSIMLYRNVPYICHTKHGANSGTDFSIAVGSDYTFTNWTPLVSVDCSSATGATGACWAPEWLKYADGTIWLDGSGKPMIVVACEPTGAPPDTGFQIYWVQPTSADPSTWGNPANWTAPVAITGTALPANAIDPFIMLDGSTWRLGVKDETAKLVVFLTSTTGPTSGWNTAVNDPGGWAQDYACEGLSIIKVGSTYHLFSERSVQGDGHAVSPDMVSVSLLGGVSADQQPGHGTVIPAPVGGLFLPAPLTGLGSGGPFFANPLG